MTPPAVSIVIPALNEGDNVLDTVRATLRNSAPIPIEIVVIDDGSTDHSIDTLRRWHEQERIELIESNRNGPARCRNRGAAAASAPLLVFMDAHCYTPRGWLEPLLDAVAMQPDIGVVGPVIADTGNFRLRGYGGTWRDSSLTMTWLPLARALTEVPFQPAGCQLVRREVFEKVGGYDDGLIRCGCTDVEFCLRVWLFGYRICMEPTSTVYHTFRERPPYDVDSVQILYNRFRLALTHFDGPRLKRIMDYQHRFTGAREASRLLQNDARVGARRERLRRDQVHTSDWFCDRFGLPV